MFDYYSLLYHKIAHGYQCFKSTLRPTRRVMLYVNTYLACWTTPQIVVMTRKGMKLNRAVTQSVMKLIQAEVKRRTQVNMSK